MKEGRLARGLVRCLEKAIQISEQCAEKEQKDAGVW